MCRQGPNIEPVQWLKQYKSEFDFERTKDTPYLAITGTLWGVFCEWVIKFNGLFRTDVFCEDFEENWLCYNDTPLFTQQTP